MKVFRKPNYVHVISEWLFLSPKETPVARRQTKNSSVSLLCPLIPLTDAEDETPSSKTIFLKSPYFLCWSSILSNTHTHKKRICIFCIYRKSQRTSNSSSASICSCNIGILFSSFSGAIVLITPSALQEGIQIRSHGVSPLLLP